MRLFHQADVGEGEVASFTFALALPLAVHVDLGHFNQVAHLSRTQRNSHQQVAQTRPRLSEGAPQLRVMEGQMWCRFWSFVAGESADEPWRFDGAAASTWRLNKGTKGPAPPQP